MQTESKELCERFRQEVISKIKATFVGKNEIIDLMGVALVAGENLFLLGPPGTAKSALVQCLAKLINGKVFDYLLTRFTEPNEVFGPFDIRKLREGDLVTNTEGMLPEADFVFLDELLNANSAILNSLLMVLNERIFRRGRETKHLPTLMVIGASNRLPEDDALNALFDRFLLRVVCENVSTEQLQEVLNAGWKFQGSRNELTSDFGVADIRKLQDLVNDVEFGEMRGLFVELVQRLRHAGIEISDRRAVKLQRVLAASAVMAGREQTNPTDLWVIKYIWDSVQQREVLNSIVTKFMEEATAEDKEQSHPAALDPNAPDAEQIGISLQSIEKRIEDADTSDVDKVFLKDQISIIRQRSIWLENELQREFLLNKADELLAKLAN